MKVVTKRLRLKDLTLLEVNARFMRHETFQRLVENIRRDGALTQAPFCALLGVYEKGDTVTLVDSIDEQTGEVIQIPAYEVLSGNHRTMAGIEAEVEFADVMVCDEPLTKEQRIAIQLSHNSISGEDDAATLKQLYESIETVDLRLYSGLDDKTLDLLANVGTESLAEANLEYQTVTVMFLPDEVEQAKEAFEEARKLVGSGEIWIARWAEYDAWLEGLEKAGKSYKVSNSATSLMIVLSVFRNHLSDLSEGFLDIEGEARHNGFVPLSAVLGSEFVPAKAAAVLARALAHMAEQGHIKNTNRWQALEYWAADYLAGQ